jgi:hypothetical protein
MAQSYSDLETSKDQCQHLVSHLYLLYRTSEASGRRSWRLSAEAWHQEPSAAAVGMAEQHVVGQAVKSRVAPHAMPSIMCAWHLVIRSSDRDAGIALWRCWAPGISSGGGDKCESKQWLSLHYGPSNRASSHHLAKTERLVGQRAKSLTPAAKQVRDNLLLAAFCQRQQTGTKADHKNQENPHETRQPKTPGDEVAREKAIVAHCCHALTSRATLEGSRNLQ